MTSNTQLLLVEPDIESRSNLRRALEREGRNLWFAGSCAEARALSQRTPSPDIAVVAAELPDGCGLNLIPELRGLASSCQCVTITARPTVEDATRAMQLGAIDYLAKPIDDPRVLANAVEWALARSHLEQQQHLHEQRLEESEERYALALEATKDGLWDWDLETNVLYLSRRWKQILGCEETMIGPSPEEWFSRVHAEDLRKVRSTVAQQASGSARHFELDYRIQRASGDFIWVRTRGLSVQEDGKTVRMAGTMSDISRPKAVEDRLVHEALHDGLTRLSNRVSFHQSLLEAFARQGESAVGWSFAVLFVDLDRFKKINDSLGHQAGDQLLLEISRRLQNNIRLSDVLARLGGDEFAILLSGITNMKDLAPILRRIEEAFREPCTVQGYQIVPTASIGIAFGSEECGNPEEILRNADIAMYRAKEQGRARAEVFDEDMHAAALDNFRLEEDLRGAIESKQLQLHFQPIFDIKHYALNGFEALVRWKHPERGWIVPDRFIAVAEECGLIVPLGRWVLRTACEQLATWQRTTGKDLSMSVNLSPRQIFDPDVVAMIAGTLERSGIKPGSLRLEITEGVFMANLEMASFILEQLKNLDIKLSLDDFGTGYSSLSYLNRLPFDLLKIDRSFVDDMARDGKALVQAIVTMAQVLDIQVVAEGIETQQQIEALQKLGCDYGQGYLLSHPLSSEDATCLVYSSSPRAATS